MAVNRGKQLEGQIREALEKYPTKVSVDRLADPMAGYAGIRNICDFVVYEMPFQYYFECKSVSGNTLSIHSNNPKRRYGAITNDQWEGLYEKSKITGVYAGVIVWFTDHDLTVYVPIQQLVWLRDNGGKSLNVNRLDELQHFVIPAKKKRVLFDYDMKKLLDYLGAF